MPRLLFRLSFILESDNDAPPLVVSPPSFFPSPLSGGGDPALYYFPSFPPGMSPIITAPWVLSSPTVFLPRRALFDLFPFSGFFPALKPLMISLVMGFSSASPFLAFPSEVAPVYPNLFRLPFPSFLRGLFSARKSLPPQRFY